jgi:hypothetical protein
MVDDVTSSNVEETDSLQSHLYKGSWSRQRIRSLRIRLE